MPVDPFYNTKEWYKVRAKALARDRYLCCMCGCSIRGKGKAHVDHIKKRRAYPALALTLSNLQSLCSHCHNQNKQKHENNPDAGATISGYPLDGSWD